MVILKVVGWILAEFKSYSNAAWRTKCGAILNIIYAEYYFLVAAWDAFEGILSYLITALASIS